MSHQRFAVLEHDHPFLHWDFLLEWGSTALAWRIPAEIFSGRPVSSQRLPDHRLLYLDYEGPVSGGRGTVKQIAAGHFEVDSGDILCPPFSLRLFGWPLASKATLVNCQVDVTLQMGAPGHAAQSSDVDFSDVDWCWIFESHEAD